MSWRDIEFTSRRGAMTKSSIGWLGQTLLVLVGLGWVAAPPSTTQAITVGVQTSDGNPGSSVEVQIILIGGNGLVAGMQTDISWDPRCVSVASGGGDTASCFANPTIPKNLTTKIQGGSSLLRALFFSMSDVEPIKQDAVLFTCVFNIDPATTATQCPINLSTLIVSDSKGGRLPATVANGVVQITQTGLPPSGPQPTANKVSAEASTNTADAAPATSGGCAIHAVQPGDRALLWLLMVPAVVHRRRREFRDRDRQHSLPPFRGPNPRPK
jgi:hypothetical protein